MPVVDPHPEPLDVLGYVERICFKTGPPRLVGAELEWIVTSTAAPGEAIPIDRIRDALNGATSLPRGSVVTFEPGGQVELSSPAAEGVSHCWRSLAADVHHLTTTLADHGLALLPTAIDPHRPPRRQLADPRYAAMERYFDRRGSAGRVMMCSTAAIQVNLDAGRDADDVRRRWRVLHAIGPPMVAAFANSPVLGGRPTGWRSTRQAVWHQLDPSRTAAPHGADPVTAWASYALNAQVMLVRTTGDQWRADPGCTFAEWLDGDGQPRRPTRDDLAYHLTTLFPPVRPRGWLEVRYIDTQPVEYWPVPVAVLVALTDHADAGAAAADAAEPVAGAWLTAARHGLSHPGLAAAASQSFTAAVEGLRDLGADPGLIELVEEYHDRYVARGRCPADEMQEAIT